MFTVSPSIYSADLLDLRKVLDQAKEFEHIHLDIDDGNFVKGISFGVDLVEQIAAYTDVELDAHLEVLNPLDYVEGLAKAGVKMLSAHIEALPFPSAFLSRAHKLGMMAGLALNLKTPISFIEPYKDDLDLLLFVSVEAGEEGLPFHASVLNKIREARKRFGEDLPIWVDGGISENNLKEVVEAGADAAVVGRAVFKAQDFKKAYDRLIDLGRSYERECRNKETD